MEPTIIEPLGWFVWNQKAPYLSTTTNKPCEPIETNNEPSEACEPGKPCETSEAYETTKPSEHGELIEHC